LITLLTRPTPALKPSRIVVAPLTNHTGDSTLTSLGALAADWIAQGLMRTTQFEVVDPRTASIAQQIVERIPPLLRDRNRAIAMAEETGSGTVLSGDLFRDGDSLRVLMQVTDAGTGNIVRTVDPVMGIVTEPSRLVEALGDRAVAAVAAAVDTTSKGFSAALGVPPSYEAYTEVSRAWESFFHDDFTDVFHRLDRASAIDTGYMTPLLMRAYVETRLGDWPAVDSLLRRLGSHVNTITLAERSVYDVLQADLHGDLWARLRASRELMRLTPTSVEGYTLTSSSALFVNRPREALETVEQVDPDRGLLLVAPYYWINHSAALHRLGDHRAELRSARQGLRRFPDRYPTHLNLLLALAALGDVKELRHNLARVTRDDESPGGERGKAFLVWRELRAHGHGAAAAEWLSGLLTQSGDQSESDTTREGALLEGDIQSAAGHWEEGRRIYQAGLSRHSNDPALLGRLGTTAVHQGNREEARRIDGVLATLATPYLFGAPTYARARIAAALGDRARAVELLRYAWTQGRPITFDNLGEEDVHTDPDFDSLRDFVPFQALVRID
jgi:TolB-like protein/tetratricopeptide (TPR) repeat protein